MSNPPAGWYPDPTGQPNTIRWWNGTQWTNKTEKEPPAEEAPAPSDEQSTGAATASAEAADQPAAASERGAAASATGGAEASADGGAEASADGGGEASGSGVGEADRAGESASLSAAERAKATWTLNAAAVPASHWTQKPIPETPAEPPAQTPATGPEQPVQNGWTLTLASDATRTVDAGSTASTAEKQSQGWGQDWTETPAWTQTESTAPDQQVGWGQAPEADHPGRADDQPGSDHQSGSDQQGGPDHERGHQAVGDQWTAPPDGQTTNGPWTAPADGQTTDGPWTASPDGQTADGPWNAPADGQTGNGPWSGSTGVQAGGGQWNASGDAQAGNEQWQAGANQWTNSTAAPEQWSAHGAQNQWNSPPHTDNAQWAAGGQPTASTWQPGVTQNAPLHTAGPLASPTGKRQKPGSDGKRGGPSKTMIAVAGAVAFVLIAIVTVFFVVGRDDDQAGPTTPPTGQPSGQPSGATSPAPTGPSTAPNQPSTAPGSQSTLAPGRSRNPKLHEGNRIASDAISFPRQRPPWSDRKRLVPQLLNSSGQYVLLQENFDGKNDWYADMFVGALGTSVLFNGDPQATASDLSYQLRGSMYGNIPVTFKSLRNGPVKRSGKNGWYYQQSVTVNHPKVTARVLTLTVAVFDLGDGTAVAYISDIPTNRPDLRTAESQVYKGINVG